MSGAAHIEPVGYPFDSAAGLAMSPAYAQAGDAPGMIRIQLPYGQPAWLATRYEDVRTVLGDRRFSEPWRSRRTCRG